MNLCRAALTSLLVFTFTLSFPADSFGRRGNRDRVREQVKWEMVPPPVQATITDKAAGGKIVGIERERRRGETTYGDLRSAILAAQTTYEAEVRRTDGKIISIEVAEDGKLISVEEETSVVED